MNKNDRTSHCVGHSALNNWITLNYVKRYNIEDMKTELTEESEIIFKTDNLAVTKEANVGEAIPIYLF